MTLFTDKYADSYRRCTPVHCVAEFRRLFGDLGTARCSVNTAHLRRLAMCQNLCTVGVGGGGGTLEYRGSLRALVWRVFVHVLPATVDTRQNVADTWRSLVRQQRHNYSHTKQACFDQSDLNSRHLDCSINNPLSQHALNPWTRHFHRLGLLTQIRHDVMRAMPEVTFFRDSHVQQLLTDLLLVFCVKHPEMHYIQGMHEVAAVILHVVWLEHVALSRLAATCPSVPLTDSACVLWRLIGFLCDQDFIEHDTFYIMERVLLLMDFSESDGPRSTKPSSCPLTRDMQKLRQVRGGGRCLWQNSSCNIAYLQLLSRFDAALFDRINQLHVEPQVFGLRMFRVLFAREFQLPILLRLWDVLFADCSQTLSLSLVPSLFVSVLMYHRQQLLVGSDSGALTVLMRSPRITNLTDFLQMAWHIQQPQMYRAPARYSSHHPPLSPSSSLLAAFRRLKLTTRNIKHHQQHSQHKRQSAADEKGGRVGGVSRVLFSSLRRRQRGTLVTVATAQSGRCGWRSDQENSQCQVDAVQLSDVARARRRHCVLACVSAVEAQLARQHVFSSSQLEAATQLLATIPTRCLWTISELVQCVEFGDIDNHQYNTATQLASLGLTPGNTNKLANTAMQLRQLLLDTESR